MRSQPMCCRMSARRSRWPRKISLFAWFRRSAKAGKAVVLSLVATPIGNLGDITLRALETLKSADVIACEDTRHSLILLRHYGIAKPLVSYHEHNEARRTAELIEELAAGRHVAVISDAGLPGINDPGHRLLRACTERGLPYAILPGPSSVLTALIGSGFAAEAFYFGGFLPVKSGQRERLLL